MNAQARAFVEAEKQAGRNVVKACELLEVSRSAFYASRHRPPWSGPAKTVSWWS